MCAVVVLERCPGSRLAAHVPASNTARQLAATRKGMSRPSADATVKRCAAVDGWYGEAQCRAWERAGSRLCDLKVASHKDFEQAIDDVTTSAKSHQVHAAHGSDSPNPARHVRSSRPN